MKPSCDHPIDWDHLTVIVRLLELIDLFPEWSVEAYVKQLAYDGYRTVRGNPFNREQVKDIMSHQEFYRDMLGYAETALPGRCSGEVAADE